MAMGRNQVRANSGDEQDVIEGRRHYCYLQRAGAAAEIKRRMRRRERRAGKAEARNA